MLGEFFARENIVKLSWLDFAHLNLEVEDGWYGAKPRVGFQGVLPKWVYVAALSAKTPGLAIGAQRLQLIGGFGQRRTPTILDLSYIVVVIIVRVHDGFLLDGVSTSFLGIWWLRKRKKTKF